MPRKPLPKKIGDEKREFQRIACHLDAICETIEGTPPALVSSPATGINLSISGVSLAVSRQFATGTMTLLKIADPTKTFWCGRSARVMYAKPFPPKWLVGGQFTASLTEGELGILLGYKPAPERRMNPRFVPSPDTLGHLVVKLKDHDLPVALMDISVGGMSLVAGQLIAEGTQWQVELTNTVSGTSCDLLYQLLHVRKAGTKWTLGGAFLEKIPNQDLLSLLS